MAAPPLKELGAAPASGAAEGAAGTGCGVAVDGAAAALHTRPPGVAARESAELP